jgi:aspartyl protease family protein
MATLAQMQLVPKPIRQHFKLSIAVMNHVVFGLEILLLWLISSLVSADEIVKCRSGTGQVIYSDVPCERQSASPIGTVNASPNSASEIKRLPTDVDQKATTLAAPMEGVLYINGYIGNKPVRFIVDTGASEVTIPYKRAIELGIPVFEGQRVETSTASGHMGAYKIQLVSVTVGNATVRNVAATVSLNESGTQDVLLGMSYLRYVSLVIRNGTLTIGP